MKVWIMMRKGLRLNKLMEQRMIMVVGSGIMLGAIFHQYFIHLKPFVPYIFAYITFAMTLSCSSRDFKNALKNPGILLANLTCLHVVLPIVATILAKIFLPGQPLLQGGMILVTAAPIGVAAAIWTGISGGNVALALTTIVLDTLLSPLIAPTIMSLTVGKNVPFNVPELMLGLALMIVLPTIAGMMMHDATKGDVGKRYKFITGPSTKVLLSLVIATNLAAIWNSVHLLKSALPTIIGLVFFMGCAGYLLGYAYGKITKADPSLRNTFIYTIGMRNITAGLVLALNYFPELTAIPVVFSILFQQPLAAISLRFLVKREK